MTLKTRLCKIEAALAAWLSAQVDRLENYYRALTEDDLNLIISIADDQETGIWSREYTPAEVQTWEAHIAFLEQIPDTVHEAASRRWAEREASETRRQAQPTEPFIEHNILCSNGDRCIRVKDPAGNRTDNYSIFADGRIIHRPAWNIEIELTPAELDARLAGLKVEGR